MRKFACCAIKGGVGKSTITAYLGLGLKDAGYKVGLLDIDITGSTLCRALNVEPPEWGLDSAQKKIIVPEVDGLWLLAIASHIGEEYAVMWGQGHYNELTHVRDRLGELRDSIKCPDAVVVKADDLEALRRVIDNVLASSKWHFVTELLSEEIVWPVPLDYMVVDSPPSTSDELFSFLDQAKDIYGVIIVSQPAKIATVGLHRTIDLFRQKQIPIIGLVANQDGFLNSHGEIEYQFLSPRVDLREVARKSGIPFLLSIPQSGDIKRVKPYFAELVDKVISSKPVVLKEVSLMRKVKRQVVKGIAKGIAR